MPRPKKRRRIGRKPEQLVYKPAGIPLEQLERVRLLQEELEALRLSDMLGLAQSEAAASMAVSRSTFQRLLQHAHHQVALALVEGRAIQVGGGTYDVQEHADSPEV